MKFFLDTEFVLIDHGVELISLGIVNDDKDTFYVENMECDVSLFDQWHYQNVLPNLKHFDKSEEYDCITPRSWEAYTTKTAIKDLLYDWVEQKKQNGHPEFWGWYSQTDWFLFYTLFGDYHDYPRNWPFYCNDIMQEFRNREYILPKNNNAHNALDDAIWHKDIFYKNGLK